MSKWTVEIDKGIHMQRRFKWAYKLFKIVTLSTSIVHKLCLYITFSMFSSVCYFSHWKCDLFMSKSVLTLKSCSTYYSWKWNEWHWIAILIINIWITLIDMISHRIIESIILSRNNRIRAKIVQQKYFIDSMTKVEFCIWQREQMFWPEHIRSVFDWKFASLENVHL